MSPGVGAFVATALAWAATASAQEATGHLEGRVLTAEVRPAASVRVAASSPSLHGLRVVETDPRGYFRLQDLPGRDLPGPASACGLPLGALRQRRRALGPHDLVG
jgi:hypothetical protein